MKKPSTPFRRRISRGIQKNGSNGFNRMRLTAKIQNSAFSVEISTSNFPDTSYIPQISQGIQKNGLDGREVTRLTEIRVYGVIWCECWKKVLFLLLLEIYLFGMLLF